MTENKSVSRLRQRWPEILLEAASVVVAVLLALAVDEWREERELIERTERVHHAISAEIRANVRELREAVPARHQLMEQLQQSLAEIRAGTADSLAIDFDLTLMSNSAWLAAQATGALTRFDFELVDQYSRLYQLQGLYEDSQRSLMTHILSISEQIDVNQEALARGFISRLGMVIQLQDNLLEVMLTADQSEVGQH